METKYTVDKVMEERQWEVIYEEWHEIRGSLRLLAEISFKAGQKKARWEVGEELCCLIGNKMLEDMEAGKLLGSQLEEYMKHYLKEWGIK